MVPAPSLQRAWAHQSAPAVGKPSSTSSSSCRFTSGAIIALPLLLLCVRVPWS